MPKKLLQYSSPTILFFVEGNINNTDYPICKYTALYVAFSQCYSNSQLHNMVTHRAMNCLRTECLVITALKAFAETNTVNYTTSYPWVTSHWSLH